MVRITVAGSEGWLRMDLVPGSTAEWILYLAAGPVMRLVLGWVGSALFYRCSLPAGQGVGLVLALVNELLVLLFPRNDFLSSGDTAFVAN